MAAKTFIFCELKIGGRKVLDAAFVPPPKSQPGHTTDRQGKEGKARQGKARQAQELAARPTVPHAASEATPELKVAESVLKVQCAAIPGFGTRR